MFLATTSTTSLHRCRARTNQCKNRGVLEQATSPCRCLPSMTKHVSHQRIIEDPNTPKAPHIPPNLCGVLLPPNSPSRVKPSPSNAATEPTLASRGGKPRQLVQLGDANSNCEKQPALIATIAPARHPSAKRRMRSKSSWLHMADNGPQIRKFPAGMYATRSPQRVTAFVYKCFST